MIRDRFHDHRAGPDFHEIADADVAAIAEVVEPVVGTIREVRETIVGTIGETIVRSIWEIGKSGSCAALARPTRKVDSTLAGSKVTGERLGPNGIVYPQKIAQVAG